MSESTQSEQAARSAAAPIGPSAPPVVVSPLEPLERSVALHKPVTRGFALVLVLVNLAVLGWVLARQNETLDVMQSSISGSRPEPVTFADPQTCWLIGSLAHTEGHSTELSKALSSAGSTMSDCLTFAQRGALGQDINGN